MNYFNSRAHLRIQTIQIIEILDLNYLKYNLNPGWGGVPGRAGRFPDLYYLNSLKFPGPALCPGAGSGAAAGPWLGLGRGRLVSAQ